MDHRELILHESIFQLQTGTPVRHLHHLDEQEKHQSRELMSCPTKIYYIHGSHCIYYQQLVERQGDQASAILEYRYYTSFDSKLLH